MRLPVYALSLSDGVPLTNTRFHLDIPENKIALFKSSSVVIEHNETVEKVILAILKNEHEETLELTNLYDKALLCSIVSIEQIDDFYLITLDIESRVFLKSLSKDHKIPKLFWAECQQIIECFAPEEEDTILYIKELIELIVGYDNLFNESLVKALKKPLNLLAKLDLITDNQIKDPKVRLKYSQSVDNQYKYSLVSNYIKEKVTESSRENFQEECNISESCIETATASMSIQERFYSTPFPAEVRKQLLRELNKLESIPKNNSEYAATLDYLTWTVDIPWEKYSFVEPDLANLVSCLNQSHYGLTAVKEHILELLTIEKMSGGASGTVLCFLGPPGTGKTSIAKAIAGACGRSLQKIALGGLSDEAELRGTRRTYIGSRPGRLIVSLKNAGSMSPLCLLDEIDKVSKYRGDPAAALLEILDPEQNNHFIDRYMEVPVDLSKVMFICTANYEEQIAPELRDRMELVYFKKYSKEEREVILNQFTIPKVLQAYSLDQAPIVFKEDILSKLIDIKQIRQSEKLIQKLLRMAAVQLHVYQKDQVTIDAAFAASAIQNKPKHTIGFRS